MAPKTGVIQGRITSTVAGAQVSHVNLFFYESATGNVFQPDSVFPDALGDFKVSNVPPGKYYAAAYPDFSDPFANITYDGRLGVGLSKGDPVKVTAGKVVRVGFSLPGGGVVDISVVDVAGSAVSGAEILGLTTRAVLAQLPVTTDAHGKATIFNVPMAFKIFVSSNRATLRSAFYPDAGSFDLAEKLTIPEPGGRTSITARLRG